MQPEHILLAVELFIIGIITGAVFDHMQAAGVAL